MKKHLLSFILAAIGMAGVNVASAVEIGGVDYTLDDATMTATVTSKNTTYSGDLDLSQGVTYDGKNYSITKISNNAFYENTKLGSVVLPSTLKEIGQGAFLKSSLSGELVIPSSVTVMGKNAFAETKITSLTILSGPWKKTATGGTWGGGTNSSAATTFMNCKSLQSVTFPDNMGWSTIPTQIFDGCEALSSVQLPNDAKTIAQAAFRNTALESVIIPASVTQIGAEAFYNAPLVQVQVLGDDVNLSLYDDAFSHDDKHPSTLRYFFISRKNPPILAGLGSTVKNIFGGNLDTMELSLQGAAEANRQAYEESSVWKPFADKGTLTAIDGVAAEVAASAEVYNLQGVKVYTGPVNGLSLPGGIYLVKQGERVAKIVF